ncbi:hypothetical protein SMKI_15G3920 [Saccharomyces mikatae IFO 1815]|uniref:Uncharacterized protein n=1 Tax=Saccharomyces mikatae IFO 1815 TaxID=226126 RepID=A0AA35IUW8_SACMI|nr:uncharacterized protein SMKI_15G3920 [Saccharomyces mikatae IFO 1815]CAI4036544.1 hypothetical protein SMKI_15G3920 [Saccharomyces mikatae IFO 1815]
MRAPPSPRKSRSGHLLYLYFRLRQCFRCQGLRRRWHIHKLHIHQYNTRWNLSPLSETRIEDMINVPSGLCSESAKRKPLLIARFSKGCQESPRVYVLQRNNLSRLRLSKRKYALRFYHSNFFGKDSKINEGSIYDIQHQQCAETVRKIKKVAAKHADIKIIFHDKNTIRSDKLRGGNIRKLHMPGVLEEEEEDSSSVYIRFCDNHSLRVKDYHSLNRHSNKSHLQKRSNVAISKSKFFARLFEEEPLQEKKSTEKKSDAIMIKEFHNYRVVSFSRVI